jgi:hypothetical protein
LNAKAAKAAKKSFLALRPLRLSFRMMARSLTTQMSSGSPSPRFAAGASFRTRSPQ